MQVERGAHRERITSSLGGSPEPDTGLYFTSLRSRPEPNQVGAPLTEPPGDPSSYVRRGGNLFLPVVARMKIGALYETRVADSPASLSAFAPPARQPLSPPQLCVLAYSSSRQSCPLLPHLRAHPGASAGLPFPYTQSCPCSSDGHAHTQNSAQVLPSWSPGPMAWSGAASHLMCSWRTGCSSFWDVHLPL